MDREAKDPYELMEEIERELGVETCAVNWPIGCGKEFKGVYERNNKEVIRFIPVQGGKKEVDVEICDAHNEHLKDELGDVLYHQLQDCLLYTSL